MDNSCRKKMKLKELHNKVVRLHRQGKYVEAEKEARKGYILASKYFGSEHPSTGLFQNNLKYLMSRGKKNTKKLKAGNFIGCLLTGIAIIRAFFSKLFLHVVFVNVILGLTFLLPAAQPQYAAAPESISQISFYAEDEAGFTLENEVCYENESDFIFTSKGSSKTGVEFTISNNEEKILDVSVISQNPELPRGCEVTSLAMLLQYAGISVDKMTLAEEVEKDFTPYKVENGMIYFGNPYFGFVGDMYSLNNPGYGVYHPSIKRLMERYLPDRTIDLTGCDFEDVLSFINQGVPVWVIVNVRYSRLSSGDFQTWYTSYGPVQITYREHSVLLTGYDQEYVYFNDPLTVKKNRRVSKKSFEDAWIQMGRQAITYLPKE